MTGSIFLQGGVEGDGEEIMRRREGRARLCAWGLPVKYLIFYELFAAI